MYFTLSKRLRRLIARSEKTPLDYFELYNTRIAEQNVNLYISRKRATKATHIHCTESGDIIWEQFYLFGGMSRPAREKKYVLKPARDKNAVTVIVVRGTPCNIIGLDSGFFKSHLTKPAKNNVYLMTERIAVNFLELV